MSETTASKTTTSPITTHVLDVSIGKPAEGVPVVLEVEEVGTGWKQLGRAATDKDGRLRDLLGADHVLMGSDFPHAEGLAEPSSYIKDLRNFNYSDEDCRLVMRDNGIGLSQRQPA